MWYAFQPMAANGYLFLEHYWDIPQLKRGVIFEYPRRNQTIKHVLALIKRIDNFGRNYGLTAGLDFKINIPKVDNCTTEDLTPEELRRLLEAIEDDPNKTAGAIMKMALFTGMRKSELFKLEWKDVNFHRGYIMIREPKGGKSQKISLNSESRQL